jgi:hypothetical protein
MRTSRRGLVDLIVMIVMIVLLLGLGTLAFFAYERAENDRLVLEAQRDIPARQRAEIDSVRGRFAEASRHIGFKGEAPFSSPTAIRNMLEEGQHFRFEYFDPPDPSEDGTRALEGTESQTVRIRFPDGREESINVQVVRGSQRRTAQLYDGTRAGSIPIQAAIGEQDRLVNTLVTRSIPNLRRHRQDQLDRRSAQAGARASALDAKFREVDSQIGSAEEAIRSGQDDIVNTLERLSGALAQEVERLLEVDSQDVRDRRESAFAVAREAAVARQQAIKRQEAYRRQADKRRFDDSRDPDGMVFLVDEVSGWVWINIGQRSGVNLNQTFQVLRPDATRDSMIQIGEIRVREIMQGNIARARVDALDDPDVYPRQGDLIRNPNFSARQYQTWALVGQFGGQYSKFTRAELTDIMRSVGWEVQDRVTYNTDALVIGGNWMNDPEWQRARREKRLNVETYQEEEILLFLGVIGPDRQE